MEIAIGLWIDCWKAAEKLLQKTEQSPPPYMSRFLNSFEMASFGSRMPVARSHIPDFSGHYA